MVPRELLLSTALPELNALLHCISLHFCQLDGWFCLGLLLNTPHPIFNDELNRALLV